MRRTQYRRWKWVETQRLRDITCLILLNVLKVGLVNINNLTNFWSKYHAVGGLRSNLVSMFITMIIYKVGNFFICPWIAILLHTWFLIVWNIASFVSCSSNPAGTIDTIMYHSWYGDPMGFSPTKLISPKYSLVDWSIKYPLWIF